MLIKKSFISISILIFVLSQLQAEEWSYELYSDCDGIDRKGVVHPEKKNGEINGFPEKMCVKKNKLAKRESDLVKKRENLEKLLKIRKILEKQ